MSSRQSKARQSDHTLEDAIEMHVAVAPWEAKGSELWRFFAYLAVASVLGLLVGAIIDNSINKMQGTATVERWHCGGYFALQLSINIVLLYIINSLVPRGFIPWMLITLSGFLFALLLFTVQQTLSSNALCFAKF
jgi:hypothetical protein